MYFFNDRIISYSYNCDRGMELDSIDIDNQTTT